MATPINGVAKLELAPIGVDGAMPTTGWVTVLDIADGSVSFTVPPMEKTRIRTEDSAGVRWVLPGDTDPPVLAGASIDIDGALAAMLTGGTWNATTKEFSAPTTDKIIYLAVRLTSKAFDSKQMILSIPAAAMSMGFAENLTRAGLLQMSFEGEATTPVAPNGIKTLGAITGGSTYTNGTYNGVALTGGTGTGATANITVVGGAVTAVTIVNPGSGYSVADVLSATAASIGGTGTGFSVPVSTVGSVSVSPYGFKIAAVV